MIVSMSDDRWSRLTSLIINHSKFNYSSQIWKRLFSSRMPNLGSPSSGLLMTCPSISSVPATAPWTACQNRYIHHFVSCGNFQGQGTCWTSHRQTTFSGITLSAAASDKGCCRSDRNRLDIYFWNKGYPFRPELRWMLRLIQELTFIDYSSRKSFYHHLDQSISSSTSPLCSQKVFYKSIQFWEGCHSKWKRRYVITPFKIEMQKVQTQQTKIWNLSDKCQTNLHN
jgi:hypothetical protein